MRAPRRVMVSGGAGFIGSNLIRYVLSQHDFDGIIVNVDKLTYAGNPENLADIERSVGGSRYFLEKGDVADHQRMSEILARYEIDTIVHLAAESHVDRSIYGPQDFVHSNIVGTFSLLEAARERWARKDGVLFHHVSTDEVFGSLEEDGGFFHETTPYAPRSPYAASKACSDHLVRAYHHTYGIPVTITNCSNNYGPYQFPEKLIPLMILNMLEGKPLPVYGDGRNVRDWLFVDDHAAAIWTVLKTGGVGQTYLVGGGNEWQNIRLVETLCEVTAEATARERDAFKPLIEYVRDRPGHDRRYAVDCGRIKRELGWTPRMDFRSGLELTVRWYLDNREWVDRVRSGDYRKWLERNYGSRESQSRAAPQG